METVNKYIEISQEYPRLILAGLCLIIVIILIYYYGDVYYGKFGGKETISDIEDEIKKLIKEIYDKQKINFNIDKF